MTNAAHDPNHLEWTITGLFLERAGTTYAYTYGFSADGKYLAVQTYGQHDPRETIIYDAATGEQVNALPNIYGVSMRGL